MKINLFICLLFIISTIYAKDKYGAIVIDEVISVYDGDTFTVNIKNYPPISGERISVRINGIDAPELKGKCNKEIILARKAKQITVSMLRNAKVVELRNMQRDKYFRIVADVYTDNKSIAESLIKNDLAVIYNGGTKTKNWCE